MTPRTDLTAELYHHLPGDSRMATRSGYERHTHFSKQGRIWYTGAMHEESPQITSPEPLSLLLESIPSRVLLAVLKENPPLAHTVLMGFSARERSLASPIVRQRLEREVAKDPLVAESLYTCWQETAAPLLAALAADDFVPTEDTLLPLQRQFGDVAVRYALLHADRADLTAWADHLPAQPADKPTAPPPAPSSHPTRRSQQTETALRQQLAASQQECELLSKRVAELLANLHESQQQLATLQKQSDENERRAAREQRRLKKVEEELDVVRKDLKRKKQELAQAPSERAAETATVPPGIVDAVQAAIAVLQKGLAATPVESVDEARLVTPTPPTSTRTPHPLIKPAVEPVIVLPSSRGKQKFTLSNILHALKANDEAFLAQLRDGIAYLATDRQRERTVIAELSKHGVPPALLAGPLRPAIVDGSNIANIDAEGSPAQLRYLQQVQRAAWREGYFPVIIIVDASLRHQIDRPDRLMAMVEQQQILMAPAGLSADEFLIEATAQRHGVLLTNDRMTDWPAARTIDKRYVEVIGDAISLGSFHDSAAGWFR